MREHEVVAAFCAWLDREGWTVQREVAFCDVKATQAGRTIYAEAKGQTQATGTDVDTMYGQLLRRMIDPTEVSARFAVVVPERVVSAVLRVPAHVRGHLRIDVYAVTDNGTVRLVDGGGEV